MIAPTPVLVTAGAIRSIRDSICRRAMAIAGVHHEVAPVLIGEELGSVTQDRLLAEALLHRTEQIREFLAALDATGAELVAPRLSAALLCRPRLAHALADLRRAVSP